MTRWIVTGLVVLNVLLGVGVWMRIGGEKTAYGQIGGAKNYVAVAGYSANETVVYVLEASTGRLAAIKTNTIDRKITLSAGRDVTADFARIK
jgi:hypothetical protein